MAEFFSEYGLFLAKTVTLVLALLFVMAAGVSNAMKAKREDRGHLVVTNLNDEIDQHRKQLRQSMDDKHLLKHRARLDKKKAKQEAKAKRKSLKNKQTDESDEKRIFVIDFHGDPKASQVDSLRKVITAVLSIADAAKDEIIVRLESPGGIVHGYGLAASQLNRIRRAGVGLIICVDKVAASGGYMMACLGNRIIAAPFAIIGSVGVVVSLPNFHRLLTDNKVDYEMITAGEYKRTLSLFAENTDKGRKKVQEDVQEAHTLFKDFICEHRPELNVDAIATGEVWFGKQALEKGLIDEIRTSDEVISEASENAKVFLVQFEIKKKISERIGRSVENALDRTLLRWVRRNEDRTFFS